MANNSYIEWTDTTWNPLAGCTRASEGCDNCYAAKMSLRLEAMALADIEAGKDPGGKRKYIGIATKNGKGIPAFNGKINLDWDELQRPYSWKKPRMVFVNSMSDLFHRDVPWWFQKEAFEVMRNNPHHTFQVLTKRPDSMAEFGLRLSDGWPTNVWAGTSVENQETADLRVPDLLKVRAAVRFLSCEPLLGPVDLIDYLYPHFAADDPRHYPRRNGVEWVIAGGESGPHARPMHPDWARSLRDQCQTAGVPFFFKQWGEFAPREWTYKQGGWWLGQDGVNCRTMSLGEKWEEDLAVVKVGKKAAGRLLDGREWNEWPEGITT